LISPHEATGIDVVLGRLPPSAASNRADSALLAPARVAAAESSGPANAKDSAGGSPLLSAVDPRLAIHPSP